MGLIRREDVESLLLQACPSFAANAQRAEWHVDWDAEPEPPLYLLMADFVRHLAALNASGERAEFPAVFQVIEDLHLRGDHDVRELATVGFLEDLQNTNLHAKGSVPQDFVPFLLPVSEWWWEEVELYWEGRVMPLGSSRRPHPREMGLSIDDIAR